MKTIRYANDLAKTRVESDSIGERALPADAYYGVQSLRAKENFQITGQLLPDVFIQALVQVKKACALANGEAGVLDQKKVSAIVKACDSLLEGKYCDAFIVDPIQGGAGTSSNMNANEVIANVGIQLLGGMPGEYTRLHPNDDVNRGQSTNDVIPTAGKIAMLHLLPALLAELDALAASLDKKAKAFNDVIKVGRTQLQDAVPMRLGQSFAAFAAAIRRDKKRIASAGEELLTVNLGATAIGTGINAHPVYLERVMEKLRSVTGLALERSENLIDGTQNLDGFVAFSSSLKGLAVTLTKIANDLRLLSSGPRAGLGEIRLPAMQNGSSIMPGKVNPVVPEVVNQIAFRVMGSDYTVSLAAQAGQLELNAFEPVIFHAVFESMQWLTNGVHALYSECIDGIEANREQCARHLEAGTAMATVLCLDIGYARAADIAKEALASGQTLREVLIKRGYDRADVDKLLDASRVVDLPTVQKAVRVG